MYCTVVPLRIWLGRTFFAYRLRNFCFFARGQEFYIVIIYHKPLKLFIGTTMVTVSST